MMNLGELDVQQVHRKFDALYILECAIEELRKIS